MSGGVVYTETTVHSPPEAFAAEAPYQIAIVELDDGSRITARIRGARVAIGDRVESVGIANGAPIYSPAVRTGTTG